jgi:predicted DNA-binding transcriptional regulator AlpA
MESTDAILTVLEVAADLRCSKAHVYNVINDRVAGVSPLPVIAMGRRKLVRRCTLEQWKRTNERSPGRDMLPTSLEVDAVGRMKGVFHA